MAEPTGDPVWAREHVLTILRRFAQQGTDPDFADLQQEAGMGRDDLASALTVLDEEGTVTQTNDGRIQLVERDAPESEEAAEEAAAVVDVQPAAGQSGGELDLSTEEARRFRVDWATGSCWSGAESADEAAAHALREAERQGTDGANMEVYVTAVEHVQVFAIERTPVRVK